jgi:tetratricopeptide (TPR) repeat protein
MAESGVNSFLQELAEQGVRESAGEFTLSADSMRKLSKYQLIDPNLYVLNILSMAVLGGANLFNISYDTNNTLFQFPGRTYSEEELRSLSTFPDTALKELFIALTALRSLEPREVTFLSDGGYRICGAEDEGTAFSAGQRVNELKVSRPRMGASWLARLMASTDAPAWEKIFLQSIRYTALDVRINGRRLPKKPVDVFLPAIEFKGQKSALPNCKPVGFQLGESVVRIPVTSGFSALLGCTPNEWAQQWNIVLMGVNYDRPLDGIPLGGLGGIIVTNSLKKNLSQTDLIEDGAFEALVSELQAGVIQMVATQLTRAPLSRDRLGNWDRVALWAGGKLREQGEEDEAMRVEAWGFAHRNACREVHFKAKDVLVGRYQDPIAFVSSYLEFWPDAAPVDQIERFVFALGLSAKGGSAISTLVHDSNSSAMSALYGHLVSYFPRSVSWRDLAPVIQKLEPGIVIPPLIVRLPRVRGIASWAHRESLCEAAAYLHDHQKQNFPEWLERALSTGFLHHEETLIDWLKERGLYESVKDRLARYERKIAENPLYEAHTRFKGFENRVTYDLDAVRDSLPTTTLEDLYPSDRSRVVTVACALGADDDDDFCLQDAVAACLKGLDPHVPVDGSPRDKWEQHRFALVLRCAGQFEEARGWCRKAYQWLGDDWFNCLLMGDTYWLAGDEENAHKSYSKALSKSPDSVTASEAVAQTSPLDVRAARWEQVAVMAQAEHVGNEGPVRFYLNLLEALENGGKKSFLHWVRLRVRTSFAHQALSASTKEALSILGDRSLSPSDFVELATLYPSLARAKVRYLVKKRKIVQAADLLSRYRLLEMLETPSLEWKKL